MLNEKRKKEIRKITTKLVEEKSKSGEEKNAIKKVKFFMEKFNFDDIHIDKFGSLIGRINGTEKGKSILLDSHIDTVGADEKSWSRNPFKAVVENDRIYGRGTSDMKGALAAMIVASFSLSEDINFKGDIYVSCTVHEELFEGVAAREISKYINPDYVIIGEASNLNIMRGQRGRAEIVIETSGKSSHSANPEVGHNAVYDMVDLIKEIRNYKETNHEILGKGILELTDIMSSPYPGNSVIPNNCRSTYDRRLLVGETKDSVLKKIKKAINNLNINTEIYYSIDEEKCWTGNNIKAEKFFPAWLLQKDHELIKKSFRALKKSNIKPGLSHYSFCTNGSHYAGEKSIPTIGFGPSIEKLAHIDNEFIELAQLYKATEGYYKIIKEILK